MCDFATQQVIEAVVLKKAQAGELFTAFDVTKEVRTQLGRGTPVPHNDVKQEVHNLFTNGQMGSDYTRSLASLPGINPQPWVYHRATDDPTLYGVTQTPDDDDDDDDVDANDDGVNRGKDGNYKVDARQTLCIPVRLVNSIGLTMGDEAWVSSDPVAGTVILTKSLPDQTIATPLSSYTVDCNCNVRITQHVLQKGGVGGKEFALDADGNKVTIRKKV